MNQASLSRSISSTVDMSVISTGPQYNLSDPVWAVSWFDLKYKNLHNLYLTLVRNHIATEQGVPYIKARLIKRIEGREEDQRDMLLLTHYPHPAGFLSMASSWMFQLKSVLQLFAVRNFTFGFMHRIDEVATWPPRPTRYKGKLLYLVHHFRNQHTGFDIGACKDLAATFDVFTHFAGIKSHLIGSKKKNQKMKTAPFLMDGLIVYTAFDWSSFEALLDSQAYRDFREAHQSNFIGLYDRDL